VELRGIRRPKPRRPHRPRQHQHRHDVHSGSVGRDNNDIGDDDDDLAVELTSSDKIFRKQVLLSVGFDDDDDDGVDEHETETESVRREGRTSGKRGSKHDAESGAGDNVEEDGANIAEEDDELIDDDSFEYESFDRSIKIEYDSWCGSIKRIIGKLVWIMVAAAAIFYIFYDDDILEESEVDEAVTQKEEPYSYNGYKDARIPDDDIAQFGGGLFGAEVFGIGLNETDEIDGDQLQYSTCVS
jgi:hypothetical protein